MASIITARTFFGTVKSTCRMSAGWPSIWGPTALDHAEAQPHWRQMNYYLR